MEKVYQYIEPEVAGHIGKESIVDRRSHPPIVSKLVYEFDGWMKDDLIESFPIYIVTESLANAIIINNLSGIRFDEVLITKSEEFLVFFPNLILPCFRWMRIHGQLGVDDFVIAEDNRLLISELALKILLSFNIKYATIEDYTSR